MEGESASTPERIGIQDLLQKKYGESFSGDLGLFDRFLVSRYFDKLDKRLFSKTGIYRVLDGVVPRPDYKLINLSDRGTRTKDEVAAVTNIVDEMEKKYGAVYIKHEQGHSGHRIMRLSSTDKTITLKVPQHSSRRAIGEGLFRLSSQNVSPIIFYENSGEDQDEISIPLERVGLQQPRQEVLEALVEYGLEAGEYAVERPIKIPPFNGKTWEIRTIIQCPGGIPQITTHWAKVGKRKEFSNYGLGGDAETPPTVISGLLHDDNLVKDYLGRSDDVAQSAAKALNDYMQKLAEAHIDGLDPKKFYAREFAVDISGELDESGTLQPMVGEIQYPMNPIVSFIPQLEKVDPDGLEKRNQISDQMIREDNELVRSLAGK